MNKDNNVKVKYNKNVAIVVLNYTQFSNIKKGIDRLIKKGIEVDIITPITDVNEHIGYKNMYSDISKYLKDSGYNILDQTTNNYKVLLEPYPSSNIKSKFRIRYRYSILSAKPDIVYLPEKFLPYDLVLTSSSLEKKFLSAYCNMKLIGNMKYQKIKRKSKKEKPTLLYLPTFGNESSINDFNTSLEMLKKKYYVITKIHHGSKFLPEEEERVNVLRNKVDEFYDSNTELSDLFLITDIVLTDNSGALFEALYLNIPVALFSSNLNQNKISEFNTIQYELAKNNIVPYADTAKELCQALKKAEDVKVMELQKKWSEENFYYSKDPSEEFVNIIESYLNDQYDEKYYELHNLLKDKYINLKMEIEQSMNTSKLLKAQLEETLVELKPYKEKKLYKYANKIYKKIEKEEKDEKRQ